MHPISPLPPALNNSTGKPTAPAALLFVSRIIATRISELLCREISTSSAIGVITVSSPAMLLPVSRLAKFSHHILIASCVSITRLRLSFRQFNEPVLEPWVIWLTLLVELPGLIPVSRHLDFLTLASFLHPVLRSEKTPLLFIP